MSKIHLYKTRIHWTGNLGSGTRDYLSYTRSHLIEIAGKPDINASSDAPFFGDIAKHNPEDLFLASLSSCHMLWYLHLCADAGVVVLAYTDNASATLVQDASGAGKFSEVLLQPQVRVHDASMIEQAISLHDEAFKFCFIANSVNFPVIHHAEVVVGN